MSAPWQLQFGARSEPAGTRFRLWAPRLHSVRVEIAGRPSAPIEMHLDNDGEFVAFAEGLPAGADYWYVVDGRRLPDPVSRWQPEGVHGPSRVLSPEFAWSDGDWRGIPLEDYVLYELHTGTFTPEGTFDAIVPRLVELRDVGITAIELMPVAAFPGGRNWGYDGVALYAPQESYGGPAGLKRLVDACHRAGLALVLDVVYNHVGPEGNYLGEFAPYFTGAYRTPWGDAINYDGAGSDGVRRFVVDNALYWLTEYHVDALRLDAIHGIFDFGARPILRELADAFHEQAGRLGRMAWLIAESDLNDVRVIEPAASGGYGIDAQWLDDFHHAVLSSLTGDTHGYFRDFDGLPSLRSALLHGYVYRGQYSRFRQRRHGSPSGALPGKCFVAFTQNHDQIANAMQGRRAAALLTLEQQKLAAAVLLFSPFLPLLFMGQEYGETADFLYFTEHGDAALIATVREGRLREYEAFSTGEGYADPQSAATFDRSKIDWSARHTGAHAGLLAWYRECLALRRRHPALATGCKAQQQVACDPAHHWLVCERGDPAGARALLVCNFAPDAQEIAVSSEEVEWTLSLFSGAATFGTPLPDPPSRLSQAPPASVAIAGHSAALYLSQA